jgi:RNA polymerase sigma-70 factor (ECF subfamily)
MALVIRAGGPAMSDPLDPTTSATLLGRLRAGTDEEGWRAFFDRYVPLVRAWGARKGLPADAVDEVTSAVLATLARTMPDFEYDPGRGYRKWLRTVVYNQVASYLRGRRRRPGDWGSGNSAVHEQLEQQPAAVDDLVEELNAPLERQRQLLQEALREVRARHGDSRGWQAFWLTTLEGTATEAVAARLGMTYAAVSMARYRIKKELRSAVERLEARS